MYCTFFRHITSYSRGVTSSIICNRSLLVALTLEGTLRYRPWSQSLSHDRDIRAAYSVIVLRFLQKPPTSYFSDNYICSTTSISIIYVMCVLLIYKLLLTSLLVQALFTQNACYRYNLPARRDKTAY